MWVTKAIACPDCGVEDEFDIELGSAFCSHCEFFDHLDNVTNDIRWRSGVPSGTEEKR